MKVNPKKSEDQASTGRAEKGFRKMRNEGRLE